MIRRRRSGCSGCLAWWLVSWAIPLVIAAPPFLAFGNGRAGWVAAGCWWGFLAVCTAAVAGGRVHRRHRLPGRLRAVRSGRGPPLVRLRRAFFMPESDVYPGRQTRRPRFAVLAAFACLPPALLIRHPMTRGMDDLLTLAAAHPPGGKVTGPYPGGTVMAECARCHAGPHLEQVGQLAPWEVEWFLCGPCGQDAESLGLTAAGARAWLMSGCRRPGCTWHRHQVS
jgi:hypothetical protein